MSDTDDYDDGDTFISRNHAARLLKLSARSVGRLADDGTLERNANGQFRLGDVKEYLDVLKSEKEGYAESPQVIALGELSESNKQALSHVERLLSLVDKPLKIALDTFGGIIETQNKRIREQDEHHLKYLELMGEILLQKEEREKMRVEAAARAAAIKTIGEQVAAFMPTLLEQILGNNKVKKTLGKLTDLERATLIEVAKDMSEESREEFMKMLSTFGIKQSPEETAHE